MSGQPASDIARRLPVDPEVLAIITAAVDQVWPRPVAVQDDERSGPPPWRFSGRWWTESPAARRDRPWS